MKDACKERQHLVLQHMLSQSGRVLSLIIGWKEIAIVIAPSATSVLRPILDLHVDGVK